MELGFETVGNATLVVHDREPVLVTDPWIEGSAYFGSWGLSHRIPDEQLEAIVGAPCVWFSHGHPDHLNPESLLRFRDRRILLPDHVGGRIAAALAGDGYRVEVVPDNRWIRLSERVRVLCIADANQDAILLVDVGGNLVVNLNDAQDRGWGPTVRRAIKDADGSFLLRLAGYGDADMANFFDESGTRVPSLAELRKSAGWQVGAEVGRMTDGFGADAFVPFSSFHRYERADSVWANEITTDVADYARGYSARAELLPAFVRYDCLGATWEAIDPPRRAPMVRGPAECGDDWSEELDADDERLVRGYFGGIEGLARHLDTVVVRVGGGETTVPVGGRATGRSVTFDVPRHSLVQALEWQVFDDLLIGNFMRTTLRGPWPSSGLYPGFTPFVTKYADNGGARSNAEVREYFAEYRRRMGALRWLRASFEQKARDGLRARLADDSPIIRAAKRVYQRAR